MKRLILVRHGETEWNRIGRYQGFARTSLNERGRWQAEQVACRLADWSVDVIYASDLPRATETAAPIGRRLDLHINRLEALREIDVGEWEGLTVSEIQSEHAENWDTYVADPIHTVRKGGESLAQLAKRVREIFCEWQADHEGETVMAVTHGGPVRSLICTALDLPLSFRWRIKVSNTSITTMVVEDGRWKLETLNDTCHLEQSER